MQAWKEEERLRKEIKKEQQGKLAKLAAKKPKELLPEVFDAAVKTLEFIYARGERALARWSGTVCSSFLAPALFRKALPALLQPVPLALWVPAKRGDCDVDID